METVIEQIHSIYQLMITGSYTKRYSEFLIDLHLRNKVYRDSIEISTRRSLNGTLFK